MIRLLVVDDHASFGESLAYMLDREEDLSIVGQAADLKEACLILETTPVDVALVDLDLAGENGTELVAALRHHCPDAVAIVLSGSLRPNLLAEAVAAGAVGVLHKSRSLADIATAVRRAAAGQSLIGAAEACPSVHAAASRKTRSEDGQRALRSLTARETDVLRALAAGLDNQGIGDSLYIGRDTVHSHVRHILRKLGVESRLQAVLFALRHGFIDADDLG